LQLNYPTQAVLRSTQCRRGGSAHN